MAEREIPPLFKGTVTPGPVGWTRIGIILVIGVGVAVAAYLNKGPTSLAFGLLVLLAIASYAFVTWARLHVTFLVDEHGVTPSLGGFWRRPIWPAEQFRTVQLRHVDASQVSAVFGAIGLRSDHVQSSRMEDVTAVAGLKPRTLPDALVKATYAVTGGGALVEIVRHDGGVYVLSPTAPQDTAEAIAAVIKYRR